VKDNENFEKNVNRVSELMIDAMHKILPSVRITVEASGMVYWNKSGDGSFDRLYWKDPGKGELRWE
jgi:hypothetical protein